MAGVDIPLFEKVKVAFVVVVFGSVFVFETGRFIAIYCGEEVEDATFEGVALSFFQCCCVGFDPFVEGKKGLCIGGTRERQESCASGQTCLWVRDKIERSNMAERTE